MHDKPCLRCGSLQTVAGAKLLELGHMNEPREIRVTVYTVPPAALFQGASVSEPVHARVCAACGHTEMYVEHPQRLYDAAQRAVKAK